MNLLLRPVVLGLGFALVATAGLGACDSDDGSTTTGPIPQDYYDGTESAALGAPTNEATCATCHANTAGATGYSGDSLHNIAYLTSYKGGGAPTLLDATNACVTGWMGGTALTAEDPKWKMLEEYLQSISDPAVTEPHTLMPEVLADEAAYEAAYAGGDPVAGEAAYNNSCARCHSGGLNVGGRTAVAKSSLRNYSIGAIAQKVRTSGPPPSGTNDAADNTPGPMPFFEPDELSAQDLKDIIAYLRAQ